MRRKNSGTNTMKEKTRVTVMVRFTTYGHRFPLDVVGNSKQPHCLRLIIDGKPPLPYTYQKIQGLIEI